MEGGGGNRGVLKENENGKCAAAAAAAPISFSTDAAAAALNFHCHSPLNFLSSFSAPCTEFVTRGSCAMPPFSETRLHFFHRVMVLPEVLDIEGPVPACVRQD